MLPDKDSVEKCCLYIFDENYNHWVDGTGSDVDLSPCREQGVTPARTIINQEELILMKKIIALAVIGIASQTIVAFAGPPEAKQVVVPAPPPPPPSYFRPNEFDIGAFATYWSGASGNPTGTRNIFLLGELFL